MKIIINNAINNIENIPVHICDEVGYPLTRRFAGDLNISNYNNIFFILPNF